MQRAREGRLRDCEWKHGEWVAPDRGCGRAARLSGVGGADGQAEDGAFRRGGPSGARPSGPGAASHERPAPPPSPPAETERRWPHPTTKSVGWPTVSPLPTVPPATGIALVDSDWTTLASSWKLQAAVRYLPPSFVRNPLEDPDDGGCSPPMGFPPTGTLPPWLPWTLRRQPEGGCRAPALAIGDEPDALVCCAVCSSPTSHGQREPCSLLNAIAVHAVGCTRAAWPLL